MGSAVTDAVQQTRAAMAALHDPGALERHPLGLGVPGMSAAGWGRVLRNVARSRACVPTTARTWAGAASGRARARPPTWPTTSRG